MFFKKIIKILTSNSNTEKYMHENALLLDVRTEAEFSEGHHSDSINIPLQVLEDRLKELNKERRIVTVCRSGARSGMATTILKSKGYDVINGGPWNLL